MRSQLRAPVRAMHGKRLLKRRAIQTGIGRAARRGGKLGGERGQHFFDYLPRAARVQAQYRLPQIENAGSAAARQGLGAQVGTGAYGQAASSINHGTLSPQVSSLVGGREGLAMLTLQ